MSVVDLKTRVTTNWEEYNRLISDEQSKIFISEQVKLDNDCPGSLDLTVGDNYILDGKLVQIPKEGIKVLPNKTVIIETRQSIALPFNVFGMVAGVGVNIFQSGFVSSGKIDTGFKGKLKIAYFNSNNEAIIFNKDELLACCTFWNTDYIMKYPLQNYHSELKAKVENTNLFRKILKWLKGNWYSVLALVISILTLILTVK